MSKGDRRERQKRQAEEAKKAEQPEPPKRRVYRYRKAVPIPVGTPSKILSGVASGSAKPKVDWVNAVIETNEDLRNLGKAIMAGAVVVRPLPVFILQIMEVVLHVIGYELTEEEAQERKCADGEGSNEIAPEAAREEAAPEDRGDAGQGSQGADEREG